MTVTIAESWKAEGRAEGKAEGRAEGRAEGIAAGKIESALKVLQSRFGEIPASVQKKILNLRDISRAEEVFELALTCQSLKNFQKAL